MKFEIIPIKRKQPLKAISKCIAIIAVSCLVIECIDELILDNALAKKAYASRKRLADKHEAELRAYKEVLLKK